MGKIRRTKLTKVQWHWIRHAHASGESYERIVAKFPDMFCNADGSKKHVSLHVVVNAVASVCEPGSQLRNIPRNTNKTNLRAKLIRLRVAINEILDGLDQ